MDKPESSSISPAEAHRQWRQGASLLDIRGEAERAQGMPDGAVAVAPEALGTWLKQRGPNEDEPVLLICARGVRSARAVENHQAEADCRLSSVEGGFEAWRQMELPVTGVAFGDAVKAERFQKHLLLDEIGLQGQQKLLDSQVLIVGAGGLGSPAAFYLAAAGIGTLGLLDDDRVERSNLQRQILHTDRGVGQFKTDSASKRLTALNPDLNIQLLQQRLTRDNAGDLLGGWDIIIDAVDNFETRYAVMDAAGSLQIPVVYGAVDRFSGQLGVFTPWADDDSACYRCLFPHAPEGALNCAEAGVLGAVPGVIGTLQAVEAIKLIVGIGQPLRSQALIYDALNSTTRKVKVTRDPACDGAGHVG